MLFDSEANPMKPKSLCSFVALALQAILLTGCVTAKVWEPRQFARFHEPADPTNLQLLYSSDRQDILVRYDEIIDTSGAIKHRAYWLERNQTKEGTEKRPSFVSIKNAQGLKPIPLVPSIEKTGPSLTNGLCATTTNGINFSLYGTQEKNQVATSATTTLIGDFELPAYYDSLGRIKQVLRTPPALVADSVIAAGIVAIVGAPYWWPALNCVVH